MTTRIAVIRPGALGDTVLTFPALHALRNAYPDAAIDAVGYPGSWEAAGPLIDRRIAIDLPVFAGLVTGDPGRLCAWAAEYDLLIAWTQRDPRPVLGALPAARVIHRPPFPPPGIHAATWLLESLPDEVERTIPVPLLSFSSAEIAAAQRSLGNRRPVIVHPGAGAAWKHWPAERFAAVAGALQSQGHDVVLLAGPADDQAVNHVLKQAPLSVIREPSTRALAALLSQAPLVIGNDTGVTHLAAATGAPTIALFGPTDPASWSPLGATILRACMKNATRPGDIRVCDDPLCIQGMGVEEVLETAERVLERVSASR
jgi:ADP-heptose:LPS heptosyltransferase